MDNDSPDPRLEALVVDLVDWVAREPRPYAEVMDAWRTSCPRLAVWEEAVDRGLVVSERTPLDGVLVSATPAGRQLLERLARSRSPQPAQNARASIPAT